MDVDNLLRYMAVHVFSVNEDSLSGMMAHNYYLYEYNGQLNIIPWDYNLALGGMSGSSATSVVNEAIDNAFAGTDFFDTLMEDETYHAQYYEYLRRLVDEYINGGGFDEFYNRVRGQIDALVEADPNAFYSYDEYLEAVETLYELVKLRGESISGQLDGTIPSTSAEQSGSDALIDASHIDLEVMGSMDIGGGGGFGFGGQGARVRHGLVRFRRRIRYVPAAGGLRPLRIRRRRGAPRELRPLRHGRGFKSLVRRTDARRERPGRIRLPRRRRSRRRNRRRQAARPPSAASPAQAQPRRAAPPPPWHSTP